MGYRSEDAYRKIRDAIEAYITPKRRNMALKLLAFLWKDGKGSFFKTAASGRYHNCRFGGLADHTWNVMSFLLREVDDLFGAFAVDAKWEAPLDKSASDLISWRESAVIVALCHDLNKIRLWGKSYYVPKFVMAKDRKSKVQSEATPFERGPGRAKLGSTDQIMVATKFFDHELKADEVQAIRYCEGLYDRSFQQDVGDDVELLTYLAHFADMKASQIVEYRDRETGNGWYRDHKTFNEYIEDDAPDPDEEPDPLDEAA